MPAAAWHQGGYFDAKHDSCLKEAQSQEKKKKEKLWRSTILRNLVKNSILLEKAAFVFQQLRVTEDACCVSFSLLQLQRIILIIESIIEILYKIVVA